MSSTSVRHLNFLEQKGSSSKEAFSLNYLSIAIILVVFVGSAIGYFQYQKYQIAKIHATIESTTSELETLRQAANRGNSALDNAAAVKSVLNNPILWSELVKKIVSKIPETITVVQLSGTISDKRTLLLKGKSTFMSPIFLLKEHLSSLPDCKNTSLIALEQGTGNGGKEQYAFHLECTLL